MLVDEYGGFSGIITVEDLVEAIMGDIHEEDEVEEPEIQQLSDEEYLVDGGILLEDLNEELPLSLFSENYDTTVGLHELKIWDIFQKKMSRLCFGR